LAHIAWLSEHLPDFRGRIVKSPIGRLRVVGIVEGISFLLLLGVAMPLKYMAGRPEMVSVVGMAHGVLWLAYIVAVVDVRLTRNWQWSRVAVAVIASILPGGPFVLEPRLRREQEAEAAAAAAGTVAA
jgi:integral membrane protein